jgi:hypothetical protein
MSDAAIYMGLAGRLGSLVFAPTRPTTRYLNRLKGRPELRHRCIIHLAFQLLGGFESNDWGGAKSRRLRDMLRVESFIVWSCSYVVPMRT